MAYDERGGPPVLGKGETWRTSFVVDSPAVQDGERVRLSMALQNAMDSMQDSAGWVRRVTGLGMDRFGEDEDYDPLMVGGGPPTRCGGRSCGPGGRSRCCAGS